MTAPFELSSAGSDGNASGRGEIRRVAVLLEMADGTLATLYSESGGEVVLTSERPDVARDRGGYGEVLRIMSPPSYGVRVEGLTSCTMTVRTPAWTRNVLDEARGAVES